MHSNKYEYYSYNKYQQIRIRILLEKYISTNMNTNTIREWNYSNNSNNTNYSLLPGGCEAGKEKCVNWRIP